MGAAGACAWAPDGALGGGFCAGLGGELWGGFCAKAGVSEPPASAPDKKAARRARASRVNCRWFSPAKMAGARIAGERKDFRVPQRVFIVMVAPRDSVPRGRCCLYLPKVERGRSECCYICGSIYSVRKDCAWRWPGEGLFQGHPSQFDPESGHQILARRKMALSSLASVVVP